MHIRAEYVCVSVSQVSECQGVRVSCVSVSVCHVSGVSVSCVRVSVCHLSGCQCVMHVSGCQCVSVSCMCQVVSVSVCRVRVSVCPHVSVNVLVFVYQCCVNVSVYKCPVHDRISVGQCVSIQSLGVIFSFRVIKTS